MLNTKRVLTKMLKRTMSSGSITFPFTVPNDGILTVIVTTVSAGGAAAYVLLRNQNNTDIGAWSGIANGTRNTLTFGVKKGDTIKVAASANMNADAYAYTLLPIFGGGYSVISFMSTFVRCLERRWSYVEHEEVANENNAKYKVPAKGILLRHDNDENGRVKQANSCSDSIGVYVLSLAERVNKWLDRSVRDRRCKELNNECLGSFYVLGSRNAGEHYGICSIHKERFGLTISERGWCFA